MARCQRNPGARLSAGAVMYRTFKMFFFCRGIMFQRIGIYVIFYSVFFYRAVTTTKHLLETVVVFRREAHSMYRVVGTLSTRITTILKCLVKAVNTRWA